MQDNLVSVIVPVYNSEKFIEECIISICKQTYRDIEVVVVDDESSDKSIDIAMRVLESNSMNYHIIRQENKGLPGARNTGINASSGDFLCFIDSDDVIAPSHISDLVEVIRDNDLNVSHSMFEYTKEENRRGTQITDKPYYVVDRDDFLYNFVRRKPAVHCCSIMVKKSFLKDNSLEFNETLRKYGEDVEFMWRLFPRCEKIGCTGKYSYKYLVRENSLMTVGKKEPWDVFLDEFTTTINTERKERQGLSKYYTWAYYRTMIGLLRIIAESTDYVTFNSYAKRIVTDEMVRSMSGFPDFKVKLMNWLLKKNNKLYYRLYRKRYRP